MGALCLLAADLASERGIVVYMRGASRLDNRRLIRAVGQLAHPKLSPLISGSAKLKGAEQAPLVSLCGEEDGIIRPLCRTPEPVLKMMKTFLAEYRGRMIFDAEYAGWAGVRADLERLDR